MGLDVFHDGGRAMRLSVQRRLILSLATFLALLTCFISAHAHAAPPDAGYGEGRNNWKLYTSKRCGMSWVDGRNPRVQDDYDNAHGCAARDELTLTSYWLPRCLDEFERCEIKPYMDWPPHQSGFYLGKPQISGGYYESVYYYDGPMTDSYCFETGRKYNPYGDEGLECVNHCAYGELNGTCLPPPEPEAPECGPESPDYRGDLRISYGSAPVPFCGDYDQCSGENTGGTVGFVDGQLRCLSDDYGAPKCKGGTIAVIDEYGFVCETLQNQPDSETPEQPNTDVDGDGEPDEYQRQNDPESVEKAIDKLDKTVQAGNTATETSNQHLSKISNVLGGIAGDVGALKSMGEEGLLGGGGGGSTAGLYNADGDAYLADLADIKQNTKDTADRLQELKDGPDDGYNTDGLGDAPTFSDTSDRLYSLISTNSTIQAVTTIPSVGSSMSCPVWTIPATPFWDAIPMDSHCQILDEYRGLLSTLFVAVWTLAAVFVFLRA